MRSLYPSTPLGEVGRSGVARSQDSGGGVGPEGDGKPSFVGVGQLWARRSSGQGLQAGAGALGAMTPVQTGPEGTAGSRAFG